MRERERGRDRERKRERGREREKDRETERVNRFSTDREQGDNRLQERLS